VTSSAGSLAVGGPFGQIGAYSLTSSAGAFGTGSFIDGSPDTGDIFGLDAVDYGGFMTVYSGHVSGAALSGTTTFANQTFASLGLKYGTCTYDLPAGYGVVSGSPITTYVQATKRDPA
jgi:hypothetical protein